MAGSASVWSRFTTCSNEPALSILQGKTRAYQPAVIGNEKSANGCGSVLIPRQTFFASVTRKFSTGVRALHNKASDFVIRRFNEGLAREKRPNGWSFKGHRLRDPNCELRVS
jgi:hypothetical protein